MRSTLLDIRTSRIPQVLGICSDSDEVPSYVNEAMQRLMVRGRWKGSWQRARICSQGGCLTLPRQIAAIHEMAVCGMPVSIRNQFWEFLLNGTGVQWDDSENHCSCPGPNFIDRGWFPTYADIIGAKTLRLYPSVSSDNGKRVLVQGYDANNQWVRTLDSGVYIDGYYMTLAEPFVDSEFTFTSITGIQKPETDGNILLYEVDAAGTQRQLGVFEPDEKVPQYRRYFMKNPGGLCDTSCCNDSVTFTGIAKLEFIPVSADTDYLFIDNIPAIKEMCRAIRFGEMDTAQAMSQARICEANAIRELNHEKQTYNENDTIAIGCHVFGSARLNKKSIGRLM